MDVSINHEVDSELAFSVDDTPERQLWCEVIRRAYEDALGADSGKYQAEAIGWILSRDKDNSFAALAEVIFDNHKPIIDRVRSVVRQAQRQRNLKHDILEYIYAERGATFSELKKRFALSAKHFPGIYNELLEQGLIVETYEVFFQQQMFAQKVTLTRKGVSAVRHFTL